MKALVIPERVAVAEDLRTATAAAWDDSQRRHTYPSGERLDDLPPQTQASWEADTRAGVLAYLRARQAREHATNGPSSRWWALGWEIEQLERACPT